MGLQGIDQGGTYEKDSESAKFCSFEEFSAGKFCCAVNKKNDVFTKHSYSDETHSQDSVHASSQFAAGMALSETASSVRHTGRLPGGSSTATSRAPNVAYSRGMVAARARSASPGLRRSPSPLGLSVAQCDVRNWWNKARRWRSPAWVAWSKKRAAVREMVEATTAEARFMHGEVESRVAILAAVADARVRHAPLQRYRIVLRK